jgi:hypothetical protein
MYSVKGDVILDPFLGTGTTTIAAMVSARNSIGFEIEKNLKTNITNRFINIVDFANKIISNRLQKHKEFITSRLEAGKEIKYINRYYEFPVITRQEGELFLNILTGLNTIDNNSYQIEYDED